MIYALGKFICWVYTIFCLPMKVTGRENIPKHGGFILACNHTSYLDPVIFGIACPMPLNFMARDTLFKNKLFGWMLKHVNAFPLKRNSADIGAIKEALARLNNGGVILLFPEGTRSTDGKVAEGLEGVGFLARKSRVPVIPAFVLGTEKAMPKGAKFIKPARLCIVFGHAMMFSDNAGLSDKDRTAEIMKQIALLRASLPI